MRLNRARLRAALAWAPRWLGPGAMGLGAGLVLTTILAALGIVPLWQPTVPTPLALLTPTPAVRPPLTRVTLGAAPGAPGVAREPEEVDATLAALTTAALRLSEPPPAPPGSPTPIALPEASWAPMPPVIRLPVPATDPTPVPRPPRPGLPVRLRIPAIGVDTAVEPLDRTVASDGSMHWQTTPAKAGYYPITGLAGALANVVLSGHVSTQGPDNVFRDLYRVLPGDPLVLHTAEGQFTYRVADLRVVKPWEVDVVEPNGAAQLTLITCAGAFDFRTRNFSERLLVIGMLVV